MLPRSLLSLLAVLATLSGASAHAQVHRCVDEQGKVSFSDTVCNGTRAQKVFGVNSSAKPWQNEDYRPVRVGQNSVGASTPTGGRAATLSTPPR